MSAQEPGKVQQQAEAALAPTLLAVVGSVAGTLVTVALDKSPTVKLIGAALGAAIPPLIAAAGRFSRLRLAGGVVVAVLALLLTYVGFTVPEAALGLPATFPVPTPNPTDPPKPSPTRETAGTIGKCEGQLCIEVHPAQVHCSSAQCDSAVEVTSGGKTRLRIGDIEFTGDIAERFAQTGNCEHEVLIEGEKCSITIHVEPGPGGAAQMRIHQNLKAPASVVSLEADTWTTPTTPGAPLPDFTLSAVPRCSVVPGGQISGADGLTLFVTVRNKGEGDYDHLVPFNLLSDTGLSGGGHSAFGSGSGSTGMQVDLAPDDYGMVHLFTVTVDPNDEIAEENESNNVLRLRVSLPNRPKQARDVACSLT
ncbi:CARDB domain-containing protein [Kribbella capetownensis]|nr:CARDB domain-containing protein [Kribbella capetownensis]